MMSFRCQLQDVMTALLDTTVTQIVQLVQKDFSDKLKQNEQEIYGLHMKLQRLVGHPQAEGDEEIQAEAEEETFQEQTGTVVEQHNRETRTNLSTDEAELRHQLAGNEGNTEKDVEIIHEVGNAESVAEAAGAGIIREIESETFQSDVGAVEQFIVNGGQAGNENPREKEGQKARRKRKRVRVKSEKEDGDDLMNEKMSSVDEVVVLKLEDPRQVEGSESHEESEVG